MSIAAIVLAAGASRRLGQPKQKVRIAGETLLQKAIQVARDARLSPVIVVTRPDAAYASTSADGEVVNAINHDADEGIASSIRVGIKFASSFGVVGAVILTCDQPLLRADHLRALVDDHQRITGSKYAGSIGVPAYFPASLFPPLLQLRGDAGARSLLKAAHAIEAEELKLDIDTEEDLSLARALFKDDHLQG